MKISVKLAAKLLGVSHMFVNVGLRAGRLPYGTGVQMPGGRWSFDIRAEKLAEYMGISMSELEDRIAALNEKTA